MIPPEIIYTLGVGLAVVLVIIRTWLFASIGIGVVLVGVIGMIVYTVGFFMSDAESSHALFLAGGILVMLSVVGYVAMLCINTRFTWNVPSRR